MMKLLSIFLLFFTLFGFGQQNELPEITVSGLSSYPGMYITTYLVSSSSSFIGSDRAINKVFKVLDNRKVETNEFVIRNQITSRSGFGIKPNAVLAVIHPTEKHALNKFESTAISGYRFSDPLFENSSDRVIPDELNKKYVRRVLIDLIDLTKDGIIKI